MMNSKKNSNLFVSLTAVILSLTMFLGALLWNKDSVKAASESTRNVPRTEGEEQTISVYKKTNESVVFITTTTLTADPFDFFMEAKQRQGTGSGVIVDAHRGIILTNLHVISSADKIEITLADGLNYKARLLGFDPESDIAVLQLIEPPKYLTEITFGDSSKLDVGQRVLAIGNPFGLNRTLTQGIISSLDRAVRSPTGALLKGLIQTDASINPGNSGGPLLDYGGNLIGLNTAILSQSGDSAGIGFSVPINQIKRVLPELIATGKVLRPKIGWVLVDTNQGPMVLRVLDGSPALEAGIQPIERRVKDVFLQGYVRDISRADIVTKVNGKTVRDKDEVEDEISKSQGTTDIMLTLRRGGIKGTERMVKVTPVLQ